MDLQLVVLTACLVATPLLVMNLQSYLLMKSKQRVLERFFSLREREILRLQSQNELLTNKLISREPYQVAQLQTLTNSSSLKDQYVPTSDEAEVAAYAAALAAQAESGIYGIGEVLNDDELDAIR